MLAAAIRQAALISIIDATNLTPDRAVEAVQALEPDIIGVTVMGLSSVEPAADFIRKLKASINKPRKGAIRIVAGGHGATMTPLLLLTAGADAVVIGEGESTFQQIVAYGLQPGLPGIACLVNGQITIGPRSALIDPLDRLLTPARDLMPVPADGIHLMETSRGCPHCCAFCETTRFYRQKWRPHSAERVAAEIKRLVKTYNAWMIHLADDNFAASPRRVLEICERIRKGPLPALILASARADDLASDPEVIPAMVKARILRLNIGVETVDRETATFAGKPIPFEIYQETFKRLREHGIFSIASFIVGLPEETAEARGRAVEMAVRLGADSCQFLPFIPFPGIPLSEGWQDLNPRPEDVRDASVFNETFFHHPAVINRLLAAASDNSVRGILARATLKKASQGK